MSKSKTPQYDIGFVLFEGYEILDLMGPLEVIGDVKTVVDEDSVPNLHLVAEDLELVGDHHGFQIKPTKTFEDCPPLDILVVPGGQVKNVLDPSKDAPASSHDPDHPCLQFIKNRVPQATYVMSICTGALLLAAAGALDGHLATTHWASMPILNLFPEIMVTGGYPNYIISRRVSNASAVASSGEEGSEKKSGNLLTSSGVISGVDAALALIAIVYGNKVAKQVQLLIQYHPEPPFQSGNPAVADPAIVAEMCVALEDIIANRYRIVKDLLRE